jgi:hypothetical protein
MWPSLGYVQSTFRSAQECPKQDPDHSNCSGLYGSGPFCPWAASCIYLGLRGRGCWQKPPLCFSANRVLSRVAGLTHLGGHQLLSYVAIEIIICAPGSFTLKAWK